MLNELVGPESVATQPDDVNVTFVEPGSLGIKFVDNPHAKVVQIKAINPGTQAEGHSELQAGMVLRVVGSRSVVGMAYTDAIGVIKAQGRPLVCCFGPVQPLPDAIAPASRTSPTTAQTVSGVDSIIQRPPSTTGDGKMQVWLFKSTRGFGINLSDSCEVLQVGGDAAALKVPLHSRIIQVNGVFVKNKL